ncbi:hypothetical protein BMI86_02545 [Thioclava sp. DLFJ5-1]|uniref:hypothetical protein n=1 Tax=Thioclava sp. DLFJ5-1 TaxID=1915314 RepID=UPI0009970AA9|nr:hypothetical protein [Thioclava sp. DLFJ5-1]OOY21468.1 hypothetical protein BMI86_02545 [Thioclava sp. DLFJ5-1]
MLRLTFVLALICPLPAMAELVPCETSIRGKTYSYVYDAENAALKESRSLREKLFGEKGEVTCPALVTLRALTPEMDDESRAPFCLQWEKEAETYLGYDRGERDAYGLCRKPSKSICERIKGTAKAAGDLRDDAESAVGDAASKVLGKKIGGMIVSDQAGNLQKKLRDAGLGVLAGASTPALAATAVVVGGAIYVCSDTGAEAVGLEADPVEPTSDGKELLGAKLPETHLPAGVAGAPMRPVETETLPDAPEASEAASQAPAADAKSDVAPVGAPNITVDPATN